MSDYEYLLKYQFSDEAKKYIISKDINLNNIPQDILEKIEKHFVKILDFENHARYFKIDNLKIIDKKTNLSEEILIFPISKMILNILENTPLFQAFANYYQKHFIYFINKDYESKNYKDIEKIIKDIAPGISQDKKGFYLPLVSLLNLELGEDYKLQYSNLDSGNIYFPNKDSLILFLSIVLKKRILRITEINKKEIPKNIQELAKKIKEKYSSLQKQQQEYSVIKPLTTEFPPCFQKLYDDLLNGNRLSHIANYHLAVFLYNVGFSYEEILELYKRLPNFDEKIASYQIKNIFAKKYAVANCETLKTNGLCVSECKVKHPLQLLKKK